MKAQYIEALMKALGVPQLSHSADWVSGGCPLAPRFHKHGVDSAPSFGVKINDLGESHYNCFACGSSGPLPKLLMEMLPIYQEYAYFDLAKAYELLDYEVGGEEGYIEAPEWEPVKHQGKGPVKGLSQSWLDSFPSALDTPKAREYLHGRGMSDEEIQHFDVRYDSARDAVCFPFYTKNFVFAGMRGRIIDPDAKPKYHDYVVGGVNNTHTVWLNEHAIDWMLPVVTVEGMFDLVAVWRHYRNVVSPWTAIPTEKQLEFLEPAVEVIYAHDNDKAGNKGYQKTVLGLEDVPVHRLMPPEDEDMSSLPPQELAGILSHFVKIN